MAAGSKIQGVRCSGFHIHSEAEGKKNEEVDASYQIYMGLVSVRKLVDGKQDELSHRLRFENGGNACEGYPVRLLRLAVLNSRKKVLLKLQSGDAGFPKTKERSSVRLPTLDGMFVCRNLWYCYRQMLKRETGNGGDA